jgi:hypothetical protein
MLREEVKQVVEIATVKAEEVKKDLLNILSGELLQIKARLTKIERGLSEKPAEKPKK